MADENDNADVTTEQQLGSIAASLLGQMPEVQEHAIAQHNENSGSANGSGDDTANSGDASGAAHESATPVDGEGTAFDPAIHSVGSDGKGILNASGKWRKKRGSKVAKPGVSTNAATANVQTDAQKLAQGRAAGIAAAHATIMMGRMIGGDEWLPQRQTVVSADEKGNTIRGVVDEKEMLQSAYADYFIATGRTDFPPGIALAMALGMYAFPRFSMPVTKTRLGAFKGWLVDKTAAVWAWWKKRKLAKAEKEGK